MPTLPCRCIPLSRRQPRTSPEAGGHAANPRPPGCPLVSGSAGAALCRYGHWPRAWPRIGRTWASRSEPRPVPLRKRPARDAFLPARSDGRRSSRCLRPPPLLSSRILGRRRRADRRHGAPDPRTLRLRSRNGPLGGQGLDRTLDARNAARAPRRGAGHDQGIDRNRGRPGSSRYRCDAAPAGGRGCPGGRASARGWRDPLCQDHLPRLRDAFLRPFVLSSADAQPVGSFLQSGWLQRGRGCGRRGRIRPAACGNRHRRLGPPARRLDRTLRLQAEPGPDPGRPLLRRPLRRADDPHRGRRRADDGNARETGLARCHQSPPHLDRLASARRTGDRGPAHRSDARRGLWPARRGPRDRRRHRGRTPVRGGRRRHPGGVAGPDAKHARRPRHLGAPASGARC